MEGLHSEATPNPVFVDLRNKFKEPDPPQRIRVEADLIAANSWEKMLEQTKMDGYERGVVVSRKGSNILTSKIFQGLIGEDGGGKISRPFFVHGVRRPFFALTKDISFVHTHPMSSDLDHLKTTIITAGDINYFAMLSCNSYVAIDRGGVHLLAKREKFVNEHIDGEIIRDNAFAFAKKGDNSTDAARESMARQLRANGYYYFYTPNLKPSPDGFVDLRSCAPVY